MFAVPYLARYAVWHASSHQLAGIVVPTQPEYRMGYQKVIAALNSGGTETGIIVNSQVFLKTGEYPWQMRMDWDYVMNEARKSSLIVTDVRLIPREPETLRGVRHIARGHEKFAMLANRKAIAARFANAGQQSALLAERRELEAKPLLLRQKMRQ